MNKQDRSVENDTLSLKRENVALLRLLSSMIVPVGLDMEVINFGQLNNSRLTVETR